jgi:hypothetical protein
MSSTPWSITKHKRQNTPVSALAPKKRARAVDAPSASKSSIRQQTLTQVQWVHHSPPTFVDDHNFKQISPMPRQQPVQNRHAKDSTLTQMDFFHRAPFHQQDMDIALIPEFESNLTNPPPMPQLHTIYEPKPTHPPPEFELNPTNPTPMLHTYGPKFTHPLREFESIPTNPPPMHQLDGTYEPKTTHLHPEHEPRSTHLPPMHQFDGTYNSPRKSRKRKSSLTPLPDHGSKRTRQTQGGREYKPSSRGTDTTKTNHEGKGQARRRSRRIAQRTTILSDPTTKFEDFEKALSQSPAKDTSPASHPPLEIQDSTAPDEVVEYSPSQNQRSPLLRRSLNLPPPPPPPRAIPPPKQKTSKPNSKTENKVATSGLTTKRATKPKTRVEDSQANIWSLPETSSLQNNCASQQLVTANDIQQKQTEEIEDSESDFGSPIANNTQFNVELGHRTSSPVPTPRLVSRSSPATITRKPPPVEASSQESLLPRHQTSASITQMSTTRVPLNDMHPSPSSPVLPPNKSITQRSIHPAAMPHPSQISTQEATQAYLGQSSMIAPEQYTTTPRGAEKITIKDSSSIRMPLSQIPVHTESQSQLINDTGYEDIASEDEGEYDLNPPSSEPQKQTGQHKSSSSHEPNQSASPNTPQKRVTHSPQHNDGPEPLSSRHQFTQNTEPVASSPTSAQSVKLYSPLRGQYTPIPGFDNETQSNFTQNGHVTAAYIHRQRERGVLPKWYTPKPYQVPGYTRR